MKNLLGKGSDPAFWTQEVRTKACFAVYRRELESMWRTYNEAEDGTERPLPHLKYSDFRKFTVTGDRKDYEKPYFFRRLAMDSAALLALIYPEEEKYLVRLMDVIFAVCDEYTWCLPAHQTPLDVCNGVHIDLFASETGFALAEIYHLLGSRLEPLLRDRIRVEIDRRIVNAYRSGSYWWDKGTNNWTAVCAGSVGCTLMLMRPELYDSFAPRIAQSMECFLSGFGRDGVCLEGCSYWHYGFGFFTVYADMARNFTDGKVDYFAREDVKKIASFLQKAFLSGQSAVSFSDSNTTLQYRLGLAHFLKNEYPDTVVVYDPAYSHNYDTCGRFCQHLRSAVWLDETLYTQFAPDDAESEYHEEDAQWFIKRTHRYGFAAKGGHNDEPHNHNDIGSFIYAKNGVQQLSDFGSGLYSRQYFAADTRYTVPECSSRSHSVPIIGGKYQAEGKAHAAAQVEYAPGKFAMELAGAYDIPGLRSLKREFDCREDCVVLCDRVDAAPEAGCMVSRLVSLFKPVLDTETHAVHVGDTVVMYDPAVCSVSFSEEVSSKSADKMFYYMDFALLPGQIEITLEIR